jgi:hypothetical protein
MERLDSHRFDFPVFSFYRRRIDDIFFRGAPAAGRHALGISEARDCAKPGDFGRRAISERISAFPFFDNAVSRCAVEDSGLLSDRGVTGGGHGIAREL